ncbi:hypothetical protein ACS0TY_024085 [Phlomoides rotata]
MKAYGFLSLIATATFLFLGYSTNPTTIFNPAGMVAIGGSMKAMTLSMLRRKLKDNMDLPSEDKYDTSDVDLQDYRRIDPIPSSRDSITAGPIEHGTPLMPYVPGPSPPPEPEN